MPKRTLEEMDHQSAQVSTPDLAHSKKKRKAKTAKEATEQENTVDSVEETKAERKERKRLKRMKKLGETETEGKPHNGIEAINPIAHQEELEASDQITDAKAAKKADKAKSNALKKAEKMNKDPNASNGEGLSAAILPVHNESASNGTALYTENAELSAMPQAEIDKFLADNFISIKDPLSKTNLRPILKFSYLPSDNAAQLTPFKSFKAPTPIQAAAWPYLSAGRDLIGVAETGSGKTMAFAVPCARHILSLPGGKNKGPRAVIISPTRELAMQSYEQVMLLAKVSGLQAVCVYGGVPKDEQRRALRTADIVVATPGRLNDLINEGCADLSKAKYVVLDEADRMLDKGFEEEIRKIINTTSTERQTLMFTATWPESVRALASTFMKTPLRITIGDNPTGDLRANARIVQKVEVVDPRNKEYRLMQLLKQYQSGAQKDDRILVFALYKKEATRVEGFIRSKGFRVAGIHGDLSQEQRTRSLEAFKQGGTPILVATDVAARGLDIPAVKLVINCTFPLTVEDYVHRIGRTGRAGKEGLAITLFTEHDKAQSGALINVLKAANQPVPDELLKFGTTVKKKEHSAYGAFYKDTGSEDKVAQKIKFD
ncbi:P-loop containing nucleoside triphosphate hydrolase [Glarea lozoyensis ATCC 20868]|uniref:RNA helicase n=1 Tax=Glarea lozoyensis (strain ATCC 20868 / MF5171) TaxID=1116229 RepID=S3DBH4_GLAL2|nr:P-loop containing nucleoside triphosphate hydrolase [Glarea lozoyensis ATCC 20868]EPE34469.1 P-loop containing nucleoside triphosphate hydrolase [Glarea lozoyensis ATCC 20868]